MGSEIIEVVERRRRWPVEVRLRILDKVLQPGASIAAVADRNGVSRGLVYQWLRQVREGQMRGLTLKPEAAPTFATVRMSAKACGAQASGNGRTPVEQPPAAPSLPSPAAPDEPALPPAPASRRRTGTVEIRLANGRVIKVDEGIDVDALARLVTALDGGRSC
jgi:transposase